MSYDLWHVCVYVCVCVCVCVYVCRHCVCGWVDECGFGFSVSV